MTQNKKNTASEVVLSHLLAHRSVVERTIESQRDALERGADALIAALTHGHKIIAFGNGGSAAQASHLAGELLGRFSFDRQPFPAMALSSDPGVVTCIANDFGYTELFARQLQAFAQPGDVAVAFTTSGKSPNVLRALQVARERSVLTVALTGSAGLQGQTADVELRVPSPDTAHIQEVHLIAVHIWCQLIDQTIGQPSSNAGA